MYPETADLSAFTAAELTILAEHLAYARDRLGRELQPHRLRRMTFREVAWLARRRNYFEALAELAAQGQPVLTWSGLPHGPGFVAFLRSELSRAQAAIPKLAAMSGPVTEVLADWRQVLALEARLYYGLLDRLRTGISPPARPASGDIPTTPLLFVCLPESLI